MTYTIAVVVYFIIALGFAMLWNMALFKARYAEITGNITRKDPIMALGMLAIMGNAFVMMTLFRLLYPMGEVDIATGLFLALLATLPNATYGALVLPAKFTMADTRAYVRMEAAYGAISIVLHGVAMALVFGLLS